MNQLVLIFIAIAMFAGAVALGGDGQTSNAVWLIFFGSAGAGAYVFWKNRGEGQGSSEGYGPSSISSDREMYADGEVRSDRDGSFRDGS